LAQATLPKKGESSPQFSDHVCCGQMARCIKIPLGTEVCLGLATLCKMGSQPRPQRGTHPQFSADVYCGQIGRTLWIVVDGRS